MPYHKVTFTTGDGNEHFYGAYGGETPFHGVKIHEGSTWSSAFMTYEEVQALLGKLRGWKGKKTSVEAMPLAIPASDHDDIGR